MTAPDPTVLLVEDDLLVRGFLADNLIADGFAVAGRRHAARGRCGCSSSRRPTSRSWTSGCRTARGWSWSTRVRAADEAARAWTRRCRCSCCRGAGTSSTASAGSTAGRTTTWSSRSPIRSCGAGSRRCCGARASACPRGVLRVGELEIDPVSRDVRVAGERAALSQKEFALLLALAAEPHAGLHEGGAAARRVGLPRRWAARARWTRTPAACATSSAARAGATWSTCGASATGWSTGAAAAA